MAGANRVTVNLALTGGFTFVNPSFIADFKSDASGTTYGVAMTRLTSTTATGSSVLGTIPPGSHLVTVSFVNIQVTPTPVVNGETVGSFVLTFNDVPPTTSPPITMTEDTAGSLVTGSTTLSINCIHGNSLIATREGLKRIDQLRIGEEVLSGNNLDEYVRIKLVAQCWIQKPGPDHDAVIFEPNSLGPNEPSGRFIIDPGHPMCTKAEFLVHGTKSLRPAGSFIDGEKIYVRKWIDKLIQEDPSLRYDLILEDPSSHYIANNIVIKSHGHYDHRYKDLI